MNTSDLNALYVPLALNLRQIRLLQIQPCSETSAPIECTFQTFNLTKALKYTALSYVWGDPTITEHVVINGKALAITVNLYSALWHLRQHDQSAKIHFWIDAICINQADHLERNHQVDMMGQIYRDADQVIAWLGPEQIYGEDNDSAYAMSSLASILAESEASYYNTPGTVGDTRGLKAIYKILLRPYWNRIWVIQEIALAREVVLFCGPNYVNFKALQMHVEHFNNALVGLRFERSPREVQDLRGRVVRMTREQHGVQEVEPWVLDAMVNPEVRAAVESAPWDHITWLCNYRSQLAEASFSYWSHYQLFTHTIHLEASEPRDKIFATLGLATVMFPVDYTAPETEIFRRFISDWVLNDNSAGDFLKYAGIGVFDWTVDSSFDLPSWVPDWRLYSKGKAYFFENFWHPLAFRGQISAFPGRPVRSFEFYDASYDSQINSQIDTMSNKPLLPHVGQRMFRQNFQITLSSHILSTPGIALDEIGDDTSDRILQSCSWDSRTRESVIRMLCLGVDLRRTGGEVTEQTIKRQPFRESSGAFSLGLWIMDALSGEFSVGEQIQATLDLIHSLLKKHGMWESAEQIIQFFCGPDLATAFRVHAMKPLLAREAKRTTVGARLFRTSRGVIGIGPNEVSKGDVVCTIVNCSWLLVFRMIKPYQVLIGPCYIDKPDGLILDEDLEQMLHIR
jgi:hypothetical protein